MMNRVQPENVHSTIFTPREYQVELVDACLRENTMTVLASRSTRTFLITMVTREMAHLTRSGRQRTLITGWSGPGLVRVGEAIQQNTNLAVTTYTTLDQVDSWPPPRWGQAFREAQVLIMTLEVLERGMMADVLPLDMLNLLVITDAHRMATCPTVHKILNSCVGCRILGMTSPVLSHSCSPPQLESFLNHLQQASSCRVDTASEIVTVLRYVNKPLEKIVMCRDPSQEEMSEVETEVRRLVSQALEFLGEHRYDLVEVYGPEYQEFCAGLPDPNTEPRQILLDFLDVLNNLGLWCADRAALYALVEVEKLKKKTAYDRHYLLLCMIFTVMARIRAVVEQAFDKYSELDQILKFSTPKVLRLVEILRQVRPQNFVDPRKRRDKSENSEAAKGGVLPVEGPASHGGEAAGADSGVVAMQAEDDEPKDPSGEVLAKHPKDLEEEDHEGENSSEGGSLSSPHQSPLTRQKEISATENVMDNVQNNGESGDVQDQSCDEMMDPGVGNPECNGCAAQEDLSPVGTRDMASPCRASSKQQQQPLANEEVPQNGSQHDGCGGSPLPECNDGREQEQFTAECSINTSLECHANGWSSSQSDSLETLDSTPSVSDLPGKSGRGGKEGEGDSPHHSLEGKLLHNGELEEECGEPSKVQIHPDSTQNCCNIPESVVTKQAESRSTLEEDLCRLNLRESSLRVGCELENSTNCDVNNGTMSAKSHLLDAAKVHSSISAPLCNGYQGGSEESLPSSGETLDKMDSQSSNMEHDGCSTQGEEEECPESPEPSHSVQSDPSDSEIHQHQENSPLTSAQSTTSQPASEAAVTPTPATPSKTNTGTDLPSATSNTAGTDPSSAASNTTDIDPQSATCNTTGTDPSSATSNTTGTETPSATSNSISTDPSSADSNTTGTETPSATSNSISTDPSSADSNTTGTDPSSATSNTTGTDPSSATSNTTGTDPPSPTSNTTDNDPPSAASNTTGTNPSNATSNTTSTDSPSATSNTTGTDSPSAASKEADSTTPAPAAVSSEAAAMADTLALLLPGGKGGRRRRDEVKEKVKVHNPEDPDSVCGLIFVHHRNMAKIIYRLLKELSDIGGDFAWIFPQYTVEARESVKDDPRAAEAEHKKQEEVLRRFRHHECNILVSTRVLEEGIDVPQCNLVLRFDPPLDYRSYVHSCGRARGQDTFYFHLVTKAQEKIFLRDMATYSAFRQVLVSRCSSVEVGTDQEVDAEEANASHPPYLTPAAASVTMASSISLLNKYCAKLPSDTFTRLTAMWEVEEKQQNNRVLFACRIMLPINSPLKGTIQGPWQAKVSLAKMAAALECCRCLHEMGELDHYLQPVGKESMRLDDHLCPPPPDDQVPEGMPRPGTTKRRQYYYKKVANCLTGEQPKESLPLFVYKLDMMLTCPIPDEQNTRGRKIYRPEKSSRSFGIVTTIPISQVSGFPVFTRSGEVMVRVQEVGSGERFSQDQLEALQYFHKFSFTHVLRLEKYPIKFDPTNAKTAFYIVPLNKFGDKNSIDWEFVRKIQAEGDPRPMPPLDEARQKFTFQHSLYEDAVVMPWYRNQDQPQYFYVAEICTHLNPQSDFPDAGFETFEKYYLTKYGLQICNLSQPLLDVDHTSGRLNLLTPRHVNRKGVALPTTSEETKRAKRENLQQKQILVPELCTIHPFPASLWRKAVCLPTILYRINALLLADQLRICVAQEVGLGLQTLEPGFSWPALDFGWSLADVLKKSQESQEAAEGTEPRASAGTTGSQKSKKVESSESCKSPTPKKTARSGVDMEIGTWSNDMAVDPPTPPITEDDLNGSDDFEIDTFDPNLALPDNLTLLEGCSLGDDDMEGELGADWGTGLTERHAKGSSKGSVSGGEIFRVGSPSNFEIDGWDMFGGPGGASYGGNYGAYDAYGGCGDFQGLADDLEGCESDVSSDMDDDEKSQTDKLWDEEASKRRASTAIDDASSDEEVDLVWPQEEDEVRQAKEEEFQRHLEEKQQDLLTGQAYLSESAPLLVEKAHRRLVEHGAAVSSEKESVPVGKATIQGCELLSSKCCDNAQQSTSPATAIVNRTETLSLTQSDKGAEVSQWRNLPGESSFSFDYQPDLLNHPGPPPSVILQALTMSNANDGVNLERLETIGDSFLKYAITTFLYCTYPHRHEGKLSYLRSKQVSNLNLYRLGKRKGLGECMVATKFEPHDNWLPPGYFVPRELEEALIDSGVPAGHWNMADLPGLHDLASDEIRRLVQERSEQIKRSKSEQVTNDLVTTQNPHDLPIFIPYNLLTQHSIPDKSIADCVEALIGAYLTTCGPRGALLFMSWLGIKVLPCRYQEGSGSSLPQITYGHLEPPQSPLHHSPDVDTDCRLDLLLSGYLVFEEKIGYTFRDRSYLLQAFTHASYYRNRLTDCYQRLEFLGDAVLDYLITRHLYEDKRQHSPGALTDLRSALVNNTIFASLAVKYDFHKYFRHFSPGLDRVVRDFVKMQEENGHKINEEYYFMEEDECEAAEDIEVPKALGDVFESVAGAIFLDSGGSLDAVWSVYYTMMCREIEQFSGVVPKSPIRELLEMEPETAKFGKPERLVDGKVRVSVEIFGKGSFVGVGRNYRIAKSTAAKRALRHLKKLQMMASQGL
ncbi:endoribonuclease Dicer-like isoform X6 [Eriocheir sinensis]|uniref:endoribonuclease Dicer-like isoform X6 n=1 Tax=Eriocheir sinensis TaxID=95602 RepID=UPI0021CA177C|nr:endoribonuclease Dicer-like isoform X6 [Eriocheir sinensis]